MPQNYEHSPTEPPPLQLHRLGRRVPLGFLEAVKELRLQAIRAATTLECLHKTQDIPWHLGPHKTALKLREALNRFSRFGN